MGPGLFLFLLALTTSLLLVGLGRRRGRSTPALRRAGGRLLEWLGWTVLLALGNLGAGAGVVLGARAAGFFLPLYWCSDLSLLAVAAVQAFVVLAWRDGADV